MNDYLGDNSLEMLYVQAGSPEEVIPTTHQLEALLRSRHPSRIAMPRGRSPTRIYTLSTGGQNGQREQHKKK